jgi:uncharacterized membrane protein YkoI
MTIRRRLSVVVAAVATGGLIAGGVALAARTPDRDDPAERRAQEAFTRAQQENAQVTRAEAEAIAQEAHAGRVVSIHLEDDGSGLEWEVEVDDGRALWEVNVNALDGSVLDSEADDQEGASGDQERTSDDRDGPSEDDDSGSDD